MMLLKYTQAQKRIKATGIGKPQRTAGGMVKLTSGLMTVMPKIHRKVIKVANKRPTAIHRPLTALKREQISVDPCDNSNDSGLGFDHHLDYHSSIASHSALRFSDKETAWQVEESPEVKRRRLEIKLESDDANDNFTFQEAVNVRPQLPRTICIPVRGRNSRMVVPVTLTSQLSASSHSGLSQLLIVCQPEQQHRARYQTEGSRGAVKDRTGNGFPVVKLVGYDRPTTLQVFIGTDQGRVAPHMFYQACRVSGKNSTPCVERKIDGTIVIEVDVEPSKDMVVTCDCVGILKERNVDVEHRFPEEGTGRSKKKSTRCRMVFRTTITNPDGTQETLQVTSQPIVCTQPPGVPEICKKSLTSCSVRGGQELFILGKNFLKDTRVVFQEGDMSSPVWTQSVQPDKEFLQQSHLVCVVPPYRSQDVSEPVSVRLVVESSGKASEPHTFVYLPLPLPDADHSVLATGGNIAKNSVIAQVKFLKGNGAYRGPLLARRRYKNGGSSGVFPPHLPMPAPLMVPVDPVTPSSQTTFLAPQMSPGEEKPHPVMLWEKPAEVMMPPPPGMLPIAVRRSSLQMIVPDPLPPETLKRELPDPPKATVNMTDLSSTQSPSMDTFHKFVTNNSLPSINVGNYLTNIEANSIYSKIKKPQVMNELPRIVIPTPSIASTSLYTSDSSNLLTTAEPVLNNQSISVPYESRHLSSNSPNSHSTQENISVIVNNSGLQKNTADPHVTQEIQLRKQMPEPQNVAMNMLMPPTMNKPAPTMTEGLDAFVNSAADSHISPTPSMSPENSSVNTASEMVVNRSNDVQSLSPQNSPHNEGALSSLISRSVQTPPVTTATQAVSMSSIQATLEHHMTTNQVIQASIEQHISPSQLSHNQLDCLIQSNGNVTGQVQTLSEIQTSLEQGLTSHPVSPTQIESSNLNRLIQSSPQLSATLEQTLPPQNIGSSEYNNLMQPTSQNSTDQTRSLTNLQVSLEQLSSQQVCPPQMIHSESVQSNNLTMSGISNTMHTSSEVQSLSNLEASLECHLPPQIINSAQSNHESLVSQTITTSQIEASVREAQVMSNIHATLEHHITAQNMLESMSSCSTNRMNSPNNTAPGMSVSVSQPPGLPNIQMTLGHISPQPHLGSQSSHEALTTDTLSLNNSIQTSQVSVASTQAEHALSSFQASLEHHLSSQVIGNAQPSAESLMPLNRLNVSVHTPQPEPANQALSDLQASFNQLSSQVLNSAQQNHSDPQTNNSPNNDLQSVPLRDPLVVMNAQQMSVVSSTNTSGGSSHHHSQTSVLSSTEHPVVSATTMHASRPMEVNSNMVLNSSQSMLTTELTLSNPAAHTLASCDIQVQNSPNMTLQSNSFPQNSVQETVDQYKQHGCLSNLKPECEKKEGPGYGMTGQSQSQPQQQPVQPVKKCEEGMPLPQELTQMSEHDLISYINPSCFDTV